MLEDLLDEGVGALLEREADPDPDRPCSILGIGFGGPFVGGLHEARASTGDDVTAHFRQGGGHAPGLIVDPAPGCGPSRAEDRYTVPLVGRRPKAGERVDGLPETEEGLTKQRFHVVFVREAHDIRCRRHSSIAAHVRFPGAWSGSRSVVLDDSHPCGGGGGAVDCGWAAWSDATVGGAPSLRPIAETAATVSRPRGTESRRDVL